ncbi:hypothetical protein AMS68_001175 [Peltaster fructicola]|uniref:Heterokaryon incompatibility domain-containing protein n=1 Tax=Peltaster fructicola TaxID=286661 RepID=A0A6H0XM10_9PEZI|nr:hypothetical protein AMS68_001175 [Peltaster fructicola]
MDPSSDTQYAALSYCWGTNENLKMTRSNIRAFEQGIDPRQLPRTISHAVETSTRLGIRYLWVDALCIIQDDRADWQAECSRMAQTYRQCQVMLSALDSTGADQGFLGRRNAESQALWRVDERIWIRKRLPHVQTIFESAALSQRGWTFQERMLAPRILHFSSQVKSCSGSVRRALDAISITDAKVLDPDTGLLTLWYVNVSVFSQRALTRKSDKVVALAGVAAIVEEKSGFTHACGIWPEDIYSLLWTRFPVAHRLWQGPQPESTLEFPSWTWASMDCRIVYEISGSERTPSVDDASILDVSLQTLTLQGLLKSIVVHRDTEHDVDSQARLWRGWIHNYKMTSVGFKEDFVSATIDHVGTWDMAKPTHSGGNANQPRQTIQHEPTSLRCHALFIARMLSPRTPQCKPPQFPQSSQSWFLLVVPNDNHTWRRVGLGFVDADVGDTDAHAFFADSERCTIEIV